MHRTSVALVPSDDRLPFPHHDSPLSTDEVLRALRCDSLVTACRGLSPNASGYCSVSSTELPDRLLHDYDIRLGDGTWISLSSYRGTVVSYTVDRRDGLRPYRASYFDKEAWVAYAHEVLSPAADSFRIPIQEESRAVLVLVRQERSDLLRRVLPARM